MSKEQISVRHKILTVSVLAMFIACKYLLRSINFSWIGLKFFLGVAPNFFIALLIPMGSYWNYLSMNKKDFVSLEKTLPLFLIMLFIWFCIEETYPIFSNSKIFDWNDILFSGIGIWLFYFYYKTGLKRNYEFVNSEP